MSAYSDNLNKCDDDNNDYDIEDDHGGGVLRNGSHECEGYGDDVKDTQLVSCHTEARDDSIISTHYFTAFAWMKIAFSSPLIYT